MPIATKGHGKRTELAAWIEQHRPAIIGEVELEQIRETLAPISPSYLRSLLRESGVPLSAVVSGVRQSNLDELEASLVALADEYAHGDAARRARIRQLVIMAKDHARWSLKRAHNPADTLKQEIILWMLTWLENPPLFPDWVRLRRATTEDSSTPFDS